jgi:acyl-CoA synthetase (AMP-forming)/AMP-acid ligase II
MIFRSRFPEVEIPEIGLAAYVMGRAAGYGDRPALIDGPTGRTLTYAALAGLVRRIAAGLTARGFGKGDVLAIYSPNLPEYAAVLHAVAMVGGITTTVNPLYTAHELRNQLSDAGASLLVTVPPLLEKAQQATRESPVKEVFVFGEAPGASSFASLLQSGERVPDVSIDPSQDVVVLPYSSGTTGLPKGVMLTHRNLVANIIQSESVFPDQVEHVIACLPFYHIYGLTVLLNISLHRGDTIVTMPRFDFEQFLQLMQQHAITRAYLVPPIVLALAKHPLVAKFDLKGLRSINSGAAPLGENLEQACGERLNCFVAQGYGLTETSPVISTTPLDDSLHRFGSAGLLIPNTECKVVDPASGSELEANQQGEVWVRGPQIMKGYLNQPEATAAMLGSDGWLHTGDIGLVDADGYLYIVDRVKELIKYKGFQVAPAELEAILFSHPQVSDCAVIGLPDEEAGEVPKAFIVPAGGVEPDLVKISEFVARQVAPHKRVRQFEVIDAIPKSPSGKILRRVLRDRSPVRA